MSMITYVWHFIATMIKEITKTPDRAEAITMKTKLETEVSVGTGFEVDIQPK